MPVGDPLSWAKLKKGDKGWKKRIPRSVTGTNLEPTIADKFLGSCKISITELYNGVIINHL